MTKVTLNTSFVPYLKPDEKKEIARQIYNDLQREGYRYKEIAELFGLSESGLYQALSGKITLSDERLSKILHLASDETLRQMLEKLIIPALAHALDEAKESLSAVEEAESQINDMIKSLVESLEELGFKASATKSERETVLAISINDVTYTISESDNQLVFSINANNKNVLTITQTKKDNGVFIDYDDKRNVKVEKALTIEELVKIISEYKENYNGVMNEIKKFYGIAGEFVEKEVVAEVKEEPAIQSIYTDRDFVITRDFQLINVEDLAKNAKTVNETEETRYKETTITVDGIQYVIKIEEKREKYTDIKAFFPESAVFAIVRVESARGKVSGIQSVKVVYGEGSIETKEEEVIEEAPGKFSAKRKYKRWYYVYENHRILIAQQELSIEKMLNPGAKVDIYAKYERNVLSLSGDETYFVRDKIKALGFRWNAVDRAWEKRVSKDEAINLIKKVDEFANVTWKGTPLVETNVLESLMQKLQNKEYTTIEIGSPTSIRLDRELIDSKWTIKRFFEYTDHPGRGDFEIDVSPNEDYYIIPDTIRYHVKYFIRDDDHDILNFMQALNNFIMKEIPAQLNAKEVKNELPMTFILYEGVPEDKIKELESEAPGLENALIFKFRYNDFEADVDVWVTAAGPVVTKDEIAEIIRKYITQNYEEAGKKKSSVTQKEETKKNEEKSVLDSVLNRLPHDKQYVIYSTMTQWKTTDQLIKEVEQKGEKRWSEDVPVLFYTLYTSPDKKFYILHDDIADNVYVLRDESGTIKKFMDAIKDFVYVKIPEELKAKDVDLDIGLHRILYIDIDYDKVKDRMIGNMLAVTFSFNNFEENVHLHLEKYTHTVGEDQWAEITEYSMWLDLREISSLISHFITKYYSYGE